jgi:hypothetical protein
MAIASRRCAMRRKPRWSLPNAERCPEEHSRDFDDLLTQADGKIASQGRGAAQIEFFNGIQEFCNGSSFDIG